MVLIQWMWADANIVGHNAARANPFRWSRKKSPSDTCLDLAKYDAASSRPVRVYITNAIEASEGELQEAFEKTYPDIDEAILDIKPLADNGSIGENPPRGGLLGREADGEPKAIFIKKGKSTAGNINSFGQVFMSTSSAGGRGRFFDEAEKCPSIDSKIISCAVKTRLLEGLGGSVGGVHAYLVCTLESCGKIRFDKQAHSKVEMKDGYESDGENTTHCEGSAKRVNGNPCLTPRDVVHAFGHSGDYDLKRSNCQHAAVTAFNQIAAEEAQCVQMPNEWLLKIPWLDKLT